MLKKTKENERTGVAASPANHGAPSAPT